MKYSQEELAAALYDVLEGNSKWYDIQAQTGLPDARCKEIEQIYEEINKTNNKKYANNTKQSTK